MSASAAHGSESSGSRRPIGESPGIRYIRSLRSSQAAGTPAAARILAARQRQGIADHRVELLGEHPAQPGPFDLVVETRIEGIDVHRQTTLAPQVVIDVLVAGQDVGGGHREMPGERLQEAFGVRGSVAVGMGFVGDECRIVPDRLGRRCARSSPAPSAAAVRRDTTCPVRNGRSRSCRSAPSSATTAASRAGAWSGRVRRCSTRPRPDRQRTRTSARHPSSGARRVVAGRGRLVDRGPRSRPTGFAEYGLVTRGDSNTRLTDIRCSKATSHCSTAPVIGAALDGSGRAGERNVPFAGQQTRSRVEANPAGARQVDLAPRVEIGEVALDPDRTIDRLDVGGELDQVT